MHRDTGTARQAILALGLPHEEAALDEIAARTRDLPGVRRVVAFGSRVRGDFRGESGLDLMVIVHEVARRDDVIRFLHDIEERHDMVLAPVIYTGRAYEENRRLGSRFIQNVTREGKVLYDALQG